jgi:putative phage-type endonuclease
MNRLGFIGGSDVQHVLNLEPYGCAAWLWDTKRGVPEDYPESYNPFFERGHALEPIIKKKFLEENGYVSVPHPELQQHPEYPFMQSRVDDMVSKQEPFSGQLVTVSQKVFEAKSAMREVFFKMKKEGLPEAYIVQMQHYLAVTGLESGIYATLWPDGWQMESFEVPRNDELIEQIIQAEINFWKLVENGPRPEKLPLDDKRCQKCTRRNSCQGDKLLELYRDMEGETDLPVMAGNVLFDKASEQYIAAKEIADNANADLETAKKDLQDIIGDNPGAYGNGIKIHYRVQKSNRFDTTRFKKDHPDLAEKYKKESLSRPFRAYIL